MRPLGITARIALTIMVALLLVQAVGALVYLTGRAGGPPHDPRVLLRRVAAVVRLVEETPAPHRAAMIDALDAAGLSVELRDAPPPGLEEGGGVSHEFLRRHLRRALQDPRRAVRVGLERPDAVSPGLRRGPGAAVRGELTIAVPLADGRWLSVGAGTDDPFRLLRFALWMGLIGVVIVGLAWWTARRLTAPLAAFARAAERLGVDGEAPILAETGPRELRAATRAFNRMQERLRRFVEDRTQMLAAISHDLRTPLTRLRLRAEFVEDPEQQRKMLDDLDQMEAMIASTLAFARDDARQEPRTRIDLAAMLQSLADDLEDAGRPAGYRGPERRIVACRPVALRRAVSNLVENAIAYGGMARIGLAERPGQVEVVVEDNGPGIPHAEMERVFQPFYRIERSRSRDTGGTGLGLSVARTIARAHGGDVTLANRPEGGLRAVLTLPDATE